MRNEREVAQSLMYTTEGGAQVDTQIGKHFATPGKGRVPEVITSPTFWEFLIQRLRAIGLCN